MKNVGVLILFILSSSIISVGQTTRQRTEFLIDSINKIIHLKPIGYINDFENVFSEEERLKLDSLVISIEKESTIEIAVVTIDTLMVNIWDSNYDQRLSFDTLTLLIAKKWRIGKKGKDNGILIGFSTEMRRIRIQNGYGIEKKISNEETKNIIDNIIRPQFKQGNYYDGVLEGILALYKKLKPGSSIH